MGIRKYIIKSLITSIPVLIGATFIVFLLMYISGNPVQVILGEFATQEQIERLNRELGLDKPIIIQYFLWLGKVVRGDLGYSLMSKLPVIQLISERIVPTLMLTVTAFLISIILGVLAGMISALKHNTKTDDLISTIVLIFFSTPYFWFATILLWISAVYLKMYSLIGPLTIQRLLLPSFALGLPTSAVYAKIMRSNMLEVLNQDYIRTAKAKGLREKIILYRHALKNSLLPIIALAILRIPWLVGGAVITESVFSWTGI
jgi:peptide/nickel transport system permease protein